MPPRHLPLLPLLALALAAVAVTSSGCAIAGSVTGARSWTETGAGADGSNAVTTVSDRSGRVQDIELDPGDAVAVGGVTAVPGTPTQLDVPWTAGSCDKQTDIEIAAAGGGLVVTVRITRDETRICDAMGLLRTLRLKLDQPIAPGLVVVRQ